MSASNPDSSCWDFVAIAFFVAGFAYLIGDSLLKGKPLFKPPNYNHPLRDRVKASKF